MTRTDNGPGTSCNSAEPLTTEPTSRQHSPVRPLGSTQAERPAPALCELRGDVSVAKLGTEFSADDAEASGDSALKALVPREVARLAGLKQQQAVLAQRIAHEIRRVDEAKRLLAEVGR